MYENAVIKKFENSQIEVISTETYKVTGVTILLYLLFYTLIFLGFYGLWGISVKTQPYSALSEWEVLATISLLTLMLGTMVTMISNLADIWKQAIPIYRVYLKGISGTHFDRNFNNISGIDIPKTTHEQDQIEICKVAQSLEHYARESDKQQAMIKGLAEKCK